MTSYPRIEKAILEIALDNGCINRFEPVEKVIPAVMKKIEAEYSAETLAEVEVQLTALTDDELVEFCCGGEDSRDNLPYHLQAANEVLDFAFDNL